MHLAAVLALAGTVRAQVFTHHHSMVPPAGDAFHLGKAGWAIAAAGDRTVTGAPLAQSVGGVLSWPTTGVIAGSSAPPEEVFAGDGLFGASIAAHDGVMAVSTCSALDEGYCANETDTVLLFAYDNGWTPLQAIARPSWVQGAFGHALDIHGDLLAIGADRSADGVQALSVVYLYKGIGGSWPELPTDSLMGTGNDRFGTALDMDDEHLLVGAYRDDELGDAAGAAYVFGHAPGEESAWTLLRKLLASNGLEGDEFGRAVALEGSRCAIGAPGHAADTVHCGGAYVFNANEGFPGNWGEEAALPPLQIREGMAYGMSLALHDDQLVVGAPLDPITFPGWSGTIHVHVRANDQWGAAQYISPVDLGLASMGGRCGQSLAFAGDALLVGAPWAVIPGQTSTVDGGILVFLPTPVAAAEASVGSLRTWPVPAGDELYIALDRRMSSPFQVALVDPLGRAHPRTWSIVSDRIMVELQDLPPALYALVITDHAGQIIARGSVVHVADH